MKTIVIVGIGALGSHAALLLRNVGKLKVIDFDRVEQKNTLSQFHGKQGVGTSKVRSLQQSMNFFFGIKVDGVPHKLVSGNAKELLGGADLVLDCLDNGAARKVCQDFVRVSRIPCLHGALAAADGNFGRVIWDEDFVIDNEAGAGAATCEDGAQLPFIAIVSAYIARSAQEFLTTGKKTGFSVHAGGAIPV